MKKIIFAIALLLSPFAAIAEETPSCNAAKQGTLACMGYKQCECVYHRGGTMTGTVSGYRWDCGINRPTCQDPNIIDSSKPYDGPQAVGIDKSVENNNVRINN